MDDFKVGVARITLHACITYATLTRMSSFIFPCLFQRSVLVDTPVSLPSSATSSYMTSQSVPLSSVSPTTAKRGGAKQTAPVPAPGMAGSKKGRKKKDPNEPQKPVSAYALFFRDTQAAIKGQNPSASFGEVSKIVASMWDSLAEEQKQVLEQL